jgi:hypothetical protein
VSGPAHKPPSKPEGPSTDASLSGSTLSREEISGTVIFAGDQKQGAHSPPPPGSEHLPVVDRQTYVIEGMFARGGIGRILRA